MLRICYCIGELVEALEDLRGCVTELSLDNDGTLPPELAARLIVLNLECNIIRHVRLEMHAQCWLWARVRPEFQHVDLVEHA